MLNEKNILTTIKNTVSFALRLIEWQRHHGRNQLPWQTRDPYRVWISEIMLQQTQVSTVLDYYPRFISTFPDIHSLAIASEDQILSLWQGLGYYSRARNLHKAAKQIVNEFDGLFPSTRQQLQTLSGVGRSTAAAIAAFCFQHRETILDGNVKRVLCRVYALDGEIGSKNFDEKLWQLGESLLPTCTEDMPAYTQGLMDLGATICKRTKPLCYQCPMNDICLANKRGLTEVLPRKKNQIKVKLLPLFWLIVRNEQGALLLQKRAAKGIWGGLWCVPCFENLAELRIQAKTWGINLVDLQEDTTINHRLTHRQLQIIPYQTRLPITSIAVADHVWVMPKQLVDYGLPKPLDDYLNQRQENLF